jgi:1-acyl-sn-glycerol-3-phosphate acyltransferase
MLSEQLRAAPLLRWAGCFGVEEGDVRDGVRAVRHAAALLDAPGRAVWLFPQGAQRPQWERPLGFRPGAALVARRASDAGLAHAVVPVSFHYELGERERPEAWVLIGEPLSLSPADPQEVTRLLEAAVLRGLDELQRRVLSRDPPQSLWPEPGRLGEGAASRLLSRWLRA